MRDQLSLKQIGLQFINRIVNPNFENKAIWSFIAAGFVFVSLSQIFSFQGELQIELSFLKAKLQLDNSPSWILLSIGLALLAYGGFALYRIKISPPVKRRDEIGELSRLLETSTPGSNNVHLQEYFVDLFKVSASIPTIRYLLHSNDPKGLIQDYRYGRALVEFAGSKFELRKPLDLDRRLTIYSWLYYAISFLALSAMAAPLYPFIDPATKKSLSAIGFPIAIVLGVIAALVLEPIRSHSAAKRLLSCAPVATSEHTRDAATLKRLLSTIHTPTFDNFIEYGKTSYFLDRIFHFWEGFRSQVTASDFHLYDNELKTLVSEFFEVWGKGLGFGEYFTQTNNPNLYKFDSRLDVFRSKEFREIHDEFTQAIWNSEVQLKALLSAVRRKFAEIDIEETNLAAWSEYVEFHKSTVSADA